VSDRSTRAATYNATLPEEGRIPEVRAAILIEKFKFAPNELQLALARLHNGATMNVNAIAPTCQIA